jgi:hypothetical protein
MKLGNYAYAKVIPLDIQVDRFNLGTNKIQRATRLKKEEASDTLNLMLVDDGLWSPRWGSAVYGGAITGAEQIDGFAEYVKSDGTRELIVVGGGKVWRHTTDSDTEITGATFTEGTKAYFKQIAGYLYISNGIDPLARYSGGATLSTYTEIAAPANLTVTRGSALTSGDFHYYAQVTALNSIGETVGSTEATTTVNKAREDWSVANETMVFAWDTVANATRYQIYISDESGYEVLLTYVEKNAYIDDNTATPNPYVEVPDSNTTGGPKFGPMELSGNRLWGTKDPNNKYRVYGTGSGPNMGVFSDFYGGFWIDLEKGGRTEPQVVVDYRDGQGNSRATVVCSTPEGTGCIWQVALTDATVGDVTFVVPSAAKVTGSFGTSAPSSVLIAANDVYFINKRGVFVLGNEKQYWGVLRTNELSVKIRPYIEAISDAKVQNVCAYYYDDKIFFSVSTNATNNNRIFYYDRENLSWIADWSVGVNQFGEFTDSNGVSHFLGASSTDGYLIEFASTTLGDRNVPFATRYVGPQFPVNEDWSKFAKLKKFIIRVADPKGSINISLLGTGKSSLFSTIASASITTASAATGLGFDPLGSVKLGLTAGIPVTFAISNTQKHMRLKNRVRDIQVKIETTTLENGYTLMGYKIKGHVLNLSDPSSEKI